MTYYGPDNYRPPAEYYDRVRDASDPSNKYTGHADGSYSSTAVILIITFASLIILVTIVGNLSVIIAYIQDRRLQIPSNYPLISLSISDLLVGSFIFPCSVIYKTTGSWYLTRPVCVVWLCCDYMATTTSVFALILITFDRYLTIVKFQQYSQTKKTAALAIVGAWLIPALTYIPITVLWPLLDSEFTVEPYVCDEGWITFMPFVLPVTVIMTYCPLLCLIFFNARIYLVIRQNAKAVERSENKGEDTQTGQRGSFKGRAGAVLAMVKVQRLAKKRRQGVTKEKEKDSKAGTGVCGGSKKEKETSWKQNKNNADFDDEDDKLEEELFIEKELEKKQSSHSYRLNQRKMGPQNRKPVWDRMSPSKEVKNSPYLESNPVLKNAPVIFTTRNQSLLLDAVANGSGMPYRGTGRPIQTVTMPELHQEPDMPGEDAAAAHHQPESKVSFSVYDVTVSSDLDEAYQQMENGGQKEKSRSSHGKKLSSIDEIGVTTEDKEEKEENDDAILPDDVIVEDGAPLEEEPLDSSNRLTITSSQSRNMSQCSFQSTSSCQGPNGGAAGSKDLRYSQSLNTGATSMLSDGTRNRQIRRAQRNMTIFKTIIVLVCVYILCCCPFSVITFLDLVTSISVSKFYWDVSVWFLYLNSALNPILYVYRNMAFRTAIKKLYRIGQN